MRFFSAPKQEEQLIAMFGIGSGSVGGALVKFTQDRKGEWHPHIIEQARTPISFQREVDFDTFFKDMITALTATAQKIYDAKKGAPSRIFCTLASPWYVSETRLIHLEKQAPFTFTQKMMDEMISTELKNINEKYQKRYGNLNVAPRLIESKILHNTLNGYKIQNPIGKKAKTLDMNLFVSVSPKICTDKIEESLKKVFHNTPVSYSSFILSLFLVARDRYISADSFLVIDINGEVSDIGIVENDILTSTISLPLGKNHIIRKIAETLNKSESDARTMFSMMIANTLEKSVGEKLAPILLSVKEEWSALFRNAIFSLPKTTVLPNLIFLVSDTDVASWFGAILKEEEYNKYKAVNKNFTVITIDGPQLIDLCKIDDGDCDQFLMVEAIALAKMLS